MPHNVVVTGGGDGIGLATAQQFLANGDRVHICDVNPDSVNDTVNTNTGIRGTAADVADPADVERVFLEAAEWMGGVDVLVNNVGISGPRAPIEEMSYEDWERTIRVNLHGTFHCVKQVLPGMKERRHGVIINISTASVQTIPLNRSVYNVSKWGVEGLTLTVAREVGPYNIRVNAIRPGFINNARSQAIVKRIADQTERSVDEVEASFFKFISMQTKIEPVEIADMAVFLASDGAKHVTAQVIAVDGLIEWEE